MTHVYLLSAAVIALCCGIGLKAVIHNYDREGRFLAHWLMLMAVIFGVLAFTVK